MQALFFFGLFGFLLSLIAGFIGSTVLNALEVQRMQVADVKRYFEEVVFVINDYNVMDSVRSPAPVNEEELFLDQSIRQQVPWIWGDPTLDPWGRAFRVVIAREDHVIRAGGTGALPLSVSPRAAGYALVSAGPDGEFQTITTGLDANDIESITRLSVPEGSDDILVTFHTRQALEKRWEKVEETLYDLVSIVMERYQQSLGREDFRQAQKDFFVAAMDADQTVGADAVEGFFEADGTFTLTPSCPQMSACVEETEEAPYYVVDRACMAETMKQTGCDMFDRENYNSVLDSWKNVDASTDIDAAAREALRNAAPDPAVFEYVVDNEASAQAAFLSDPLTGFVVRYDPLATSGGLNDAARFTLELPGTDSPWANSDGQFMFHMDTGG